MLTIADEGGGSNDDNFKLQKKSMSKIVIEKGRRANADES